MASRAQITEILPETLPGDFLEWDEAPPSVSALENTGDAVALHPRQSLSPALLSSPDMQLQKAVPAVDDHRFSGPRPNGAPAARAMTQFHEIVIHSLSASAVERTGPAKKWSIIAATSALLALILAAAMIPVFNHGRVASAKPAAAPAPIMAAIRQPEGAAPTRAHSKLTASASTAAAIAARKVQISSEAQRRPVLNAGPSPEQARMMHDQLHTPARLQMKATLAEQDPLPPGSFVAAGIEGLDNGNAIGTVFGSSKQLKVQTASQQVIKVTPGVAMGLLIQKTQPVYPSIAKSARISGTIVLAATISKTGNIENLSVMSGPPVLRRSAVDAVRTWRFKPYMLYNQPTAIETTIHLYFSLN